MNTAVVLPVVLASLLGSVHCAGMCGGFVAAYSGEGLKKSAPSHLGYHAARLITYTTLGASAGALGSALDLAGRSVGLGRLAALLTGLSLVLLGAAKLLRGPRLIQLRPSAPSGPLRWFGALLARLHAAPPVLRAFLLGLGTTLLPCGWLYSFVAVAAGTGSVTRGAAVMAAFWLGSVPALLGLGLSLGWLGEKLRAALPKVAAVSSIALGVLTLGARVLAAPSAEPSSSPDVAPHAQGCPLHAKSSP